jgi:hypothetical protein
LHAWYGNRYEAMWQNLKAPDVRAEWARALADGRYTVPEVTRGVDACKTLDWPPSLPEFLKLCRPPLKYEDAHLEAVEQMRLRESGRDTWTSPAIFWAACVLGSDVRQQYRFIEARWRRALDHCRRDYAAGLLTDVPPVPKALPPPPPSVMPAETRAWMARILRKELPNAAI